MSFHRQEASPLSVEQRAPWKLRDKENLPGTGSTADVGMQPLFDMAPDPAVLAARLRAEDRDLTRYCAAIVREHATRFGWSKRQRNDVTRSLRMLQGLRSSPTSKIRATDVLQLRQYSGNVLSTIDVLAAAGLLIEDTAHCHRTILRCQNQHPATSNERPTRGMAAGADQWLPPSAPAGEA